jgi:hypothetical protein
MHHAASPRPAGASTGGAEAETSYHGHVLARLQQEWAGVLAGQPERPDIRNGSDVYKHVRSDLRQLALSLKESFVLLADSQHYAGQQGAAPSGREGGGELGGAVTELRGIARVRLLWLVGLLPPERHNRGVGTLRVLVTGCDRAVKGVGAGSPALLCCPAAAALTGRANSD